MRDPAWRQAGDDVDGDDGGLAGVVVGVMVGAPAFDLDGLGGVGKGMCSLTGQIFMRRISRRPVPLSSVRSFRMVSPVTHETGIEPVQFCVRYCDLEL
ncbi:hypothetical protein HD597_000498 [Nonomuraea thailandensis]|uniref:Uncharacterized protein n=1 Tax=Nonomuraea thailandensis TaxID=1188745 RepID=A0A9X2GF20_9ACTN|nr:hypothetical protein [Nonomuraea thailandensis]MCP2353478.1 hypothetical protein [Nonomuraea thailandensis]